MAKGHKGKRRRQQPSLGAGPGTTQMSIGGRTWMETATSPGCESRTQPERKVSDSIWRDRMPSPPMLKCRS